MEFAQLFKKYRLKSEFESLSKFADAFATKGYFYEVSIFCHWQKGRRIPTKRSVLLTIVELFIESGAITSLDKANEFLDSAGQGYMTKKEQIKFVNNLTD